MNNLIKNLNKYYKSNISVSRTYSDITIIDDIPKIKLYASKKGKFPYFMKPSDKITTLSKYYVQLLSTYKKLIKEDKEYQTISILKFDQLLKKVIKSNIKYIYTIIDYPVEKPAFFKFTCKFPITYGLLFYTYTLAYKLLYYLEEKDLKRKPTFGKHVPRYNRDKTDGPYGIYGHAISDLIYNDYPLIKIKKDSIYCLITVDS
jgi:hypothetical protein